MNTQQHSVLFGPYGTQLSTLGKQRGFIVEKPTDVLGNSAIADAIGDIVDGYLDAGAKRFTVPAFDARALLRENGGLKDYRAVTERRLQIVLERLERRKDLNREQIQGLFSLGPKNDCYEPDQAPDTKESAEFHRDQVEQVDALSKKYGIQLTLQFETFPDGEEAEGVAIALRGLNREKIDAILSYPFTYEGTPLGDESFSSIIQRVDQHRNGLRIRHGLNCGPIEGIQKALSALGELSRRVKVVYPNASSRPQKELDSATTINGLSDRRKTAAFIRHLAEHHELEIVGGCCGYNQEDIHELANGTHVSSEIPPTDVKSRLETQTTVA